MFLEQGTITSSLDCLNFIHAQKSTKKNVNLRKILLKFIQKYRKGSLSELLRRSLRLKFF